MKTPPFTINKDIIWENQPKYTKTTKLSALCLNYFLLFHHVFYEYMSQNTNLICLIDEVEN